MSQRSHQIKQHAVFNIHLTKHQHISFKLGAAFHSATVHTAGPPHRQTCQHAAVQTPQLTGFGVSGVTACRRHQWTQRSRWLTVHGLLSREVEALRVERLEQTETDKRKQRCYRVRGEINPLGTRQHIVIGVGTNRTKSKKIRSKKKTSRKHLLILFQQRLAAYQVIQAQPL